MLQREGTSAIGCRDHWLTSEDFEKFSAYMAIACIALAVCMSQGFIALPTELQ